MNDAFLLWIHGDGEKRKESELVDYKFYCFDGDPKFLYVSQGWENRGGAIVSFVDSDWNRMPFGRTDHQEFDELPPRPDDIDELEDIARVLSRGIPFVRVDLYDIGGTPKFSEMTLTTNAGFMPFDPPEADAEVGKLLALPN